MGLKLEWAIGLVIVAILSVSFKIKVSNNENNNTLFTKELEFSDTTFIEVDTNKTEGVAYSKYGVRDNSILVLHDFQYETSHIELLSAQTATYKKNEIYLDTNIVVNQKEGFRYRAEHAVFHKNTEILHITSPFTAMMNKNIIKGNNLYYYTRKKEIYATNITATVYTAKK